MAAVNIKSFLPDREIEICQRVRQVRLGLKWKQPDFSKEIGITRERLASYEYAKAPIRFGLADSLCRKFSINQRWLAFGRSPKEPYFRIPPALMDELNKNLLFSDVYDRSLSALVEEKFKLIKETLNWGEDGSGLEVGIHLFSDIPLGAPAAEYARNQLNLEMGTAFIGLPPQLRGDLAKELVRTIEDFWAKHRYEIDAYEPVWLATAYEQKEAADAIYEKCSPLLDIPQKKAQDQDVSNANDPLAKLIERLRKLVSRTRGTSAALARLLGVTRQAISNWLSGDSFPSAVMALRLLEWVDAEEVKQKRSGSAVTPPEIKTPKGIPSDESQTESPTRPESESARKPKKSST
jgi:transcriptional regulator with XRE-family HTH domain